MAGETTGLPRALNQSVALRVPTTVHFWHLLPPVEPPYVVVCVGLTPRSGGCFGPFWTLQLFQIFGQKSSLAVRLYLSSCLRTLAIVVWALLAISWRGYLLAALLNHRRFRCRLLEGNLLSPTSSHLRPQPGQIQYFPSPRAASTNNSQLTHNLTIMSALLVA